MIRSYYLYHVKLIAYYVNLFVLNPFDAYIAVIYVTEHAPR